MIRAGEINIVMNKRISTFLFITTMVLVAIFYNYQEIVFKRPQSVHKWRQADCASIALNYYQGGFNLKHSETHNLTSDGGTSGKSLTSEVPILYLSVASLYKVFGYHDSVYRIFNTLLFFLGLFFLFRLFSYLLKDPFWAISLTLLFFTAPVLVYYGNNYLPNSSALAFSIAGWYYFTRYWTENTPKWFYFSLALFFIAAMLKVTALFSLIAITGIFLLDITGIKKVKSEGKLFSKPAQQIGAIALVFLLIGCWLLYAHNFNQKHGCSYFSTNIFPIWDLSGAEIKGVLENVQKLWLPDYFHISVLLLLAACFVFLIIQFKKANKVLAYSILIVFAECIAYVLLQFWTFADHDYYTIDMYILPVLLVAGASDLLNRHFGKIFKSAIVKTAFAFFVIFNIYYAHKQLNNRYEGWMNDYPQNKDLYTITPYLRQIGITPQDTVISIPDVSHVSLYLMNQKGWTEYTDTKFSKSEPVRYNQDSAGISASIRKGAKYLVLNGISELYRKPYLKPFCTNLAGQYGNILIFNLKSPVKNFSLEDRIISQVLTCDAENLSTDKKLFTGSPDGTAFSNGETQSMEVAHSGQFSSKLNTDRPYGMTIVLKKLQFGESFLITAWRKITGTAKGGIIASSSPVSYYNGDNKVIETSPGGWEKIQVEVFIPAELAGQELSVYVYNPEKDAVYFDDLEIKRYKSIFDISPR
jgi:hypothetical protein